MRPVFEGVHEQAFVPRCDRRPSNEDQMSTGIEARRTDAADAAFSDHPRNQPEMAFAAVRRRILALLPVGLFLALAVALGWAWGKTPAVIPSALIGRPVPEFNLPPVQGRERGLSSADLKGEVSLVNVFASWCTACRDEHPVFMELRRANAVPIHGINYKDRPSDAERWLNTLGDPYTRTGVDRYGRVAIDWGLYGVPETLVVDAKRIAFKHVGAITPEVYREKIRPLIEKRRK
jgi:cytochrome c biogenesis protein CcmG, thiol:disulfide interchange protein DsbE